MLEVGYSARSGADLEWFLRTDRAIEALQRLAERGQHWAPSIPDLLIAATAEVNNRSVLHLDKDFELIADLTGRQVERSST